ncbi:MAG TPA: hypothetical protein VLA10_00550 [Ilumatobacter sp.]|nr:hypothetical protein [Ilumatobacter sp.]
MSKTETPSKISAADLESKLRAFQGDVQSKVESKKNTMLMVGAGGVTLLLIIFFLMGKRSGKKRTTLVEIRRI